MMSHESKLSVFKGCIEVIEEKIVYQGFLSVKQFILRHSLFSGGWSPQVNREVVLSDRVVGVLLFDPVADKVLLVEQFRLGPYEVGEPAWVSEIIAGRVDKNESLEKAAHREVMEEAGCTVTHLLPIADYYPTPSGCDEKVKLYCGFFSSEGTGGRLCGMKNEEEDIRTCLIETHIIFEALNAGEINNAATLIALQWLQAHHASLTSGSVVVR